MDRAAPWVSPACACARAMKLSAPKRLSATAMLSATTRASEMDRAAPWMSPARACASAMWASARYAVVRLRDAPGSGQGFVQRVRGLLHHGFGLHRAGRRCLARFEPRPGGAVMRVRVSGCGEEQKHDRRQGTCGLHGRSRGWNSVISEAERRAPRRRLHAGAGTTDPNLGSMQGGPRFA